MMTGSNISMIPTESNLVTSSIGVETGDADSGRCGTHNTTDEGNELGDSCKEVGIFSMSPSETALFPFLKSNYPHTSKYPVTADTTAMKSEESPLPILQSRLLHQRAVMRSSHDTPSSPDIYLSSPETPVSFHLSSHCSPSEDVKSHSYFHRFGASERYSLFRKGADLSGMPVSPCTSYGSSLLPLESSSSERASSSKGKGKEALSSPEQSSTSAIAVQRVEGDPALCTKASTVVPELSNYPASPLGSAPSNSSYSIDPCGSPFSSSPRFSPPAVTTTSTTDVHLIVQPQSSSIYPNRLANHLRSRSPTPSPNAFHSTVSFQYTLSESSNMSSPALAENASPPKHTKVSILSLLRRGRSFTRRKGKEKAQSKTSRPSVVHRDTYPQANFATQRSRSGISTGLPELSSLPSPGVGSVDEDLFRPNPIMVNEGSSSRGNAVVVDCPSVVTPDGEVRVDGEDDSSLGSSTINSPR
ncbi:hypothetical protein FRC03_009463 [Tulasnella sp. 419]|nr:hypothetical protein FRC03_009463 [Tulasnella sp. 419]